VSAKKSVLAAINNSVIENGVVYTTGSGSASTATSGYSAAAMAANGSNSNPRRPSASTTNKQGVDRISLNEIDASTLL
jgi:hypothetical protein